MRVPLEADGGLIPITCCQMISVEAAESCREEKRWQAAQAAGQRLHRSPRFMRILASQHLI